MYLWVTGYAGGCGCLGIFGGDSPSPAETTRDTTLFVAAIGAWFGRAFDPSLDRMMRAEA